MRMNERKIHVVMARAAVGLAVFAGIPLVLFAQWEPDRRLTIEGSPSQTSYNNAWCVAAGGDLVHVVWFDGRDGDWEIYYKRSSDRGLTWGADMRLTNDGAVSTDPSVAGSGLSLHVVWRDTRDGNDEIYYKQSTDAGVTWGNDVRLTSDTGSSTYPSTCVSGSVVHVVWNDKRSGNAEIYYKRSTDGGNTWGSDLRLTNSGANLGYPSIACAGPIVHAVWGDPREGTPQIFYKRSTDGGATWGADTRLTSGTNYALFPSIAAVDSAVHVVWHDGRNNLEIYYKRSMDRGVTWGADTRLTFNAFQSWYPSVAAAGSGVHTVWRDDRNAFGAIYYVRSMNQGASWGSDTNLTNNSFYNSDRPSIALSGPVVHVVWWDNRDGNMEIYYKRNPTGNVVEIEEENQKSNLKNQKCRITPNPFRDRVTIALDGADQPISGSVGSRPGHQQSGLQIYDASGRMVRSFPLATRYSLLATSIVWDGRDNQGFDLPAGVYFVRYADAEYQKTEMVVLLR